jgi:hypothetical protein
MWVFTSPSKAFLAMIRREQKEAGSSAQGDPAKRVLDPAARRVQRRWPPTDRSPASWRWLAPSGAFQEVRADIAELALNVKGPDRLPTRERRTAASWTHRAFSWSASLLV